MACRNCPKCGRPKNCDDELCVVCELKEIALEAPKVIFNRIISKRGSNHEESAGQGTGGSDVRNS